MPDNSYLNYVLDEVLGYISGITSRAMFGGYGIYKDGIIFAIIAYDQLYFKVDDTNKADYEAHDSGPFVYDQGGHKQTTMSYWLVPEEIMENHEKVAEWMEKSVEISRKKKKK